MGYNRDNFIRIKQSYEEKRSAKLAQSRARLEEVHARFPEIADIDRELANTGILIMQEITAGKEGLDERLNNIRLDNEELQSRRRRLLVEYGLPEDYTDIRYDCKKCDDTGFVGTKMCSCMRFQMTMAGLESSGLGKLFEMQNFDTFSLKYYASDPRAYKQMATNLEICTDYADNFDDKTKENLLFGGKTGLGKTHISTAIAGSVISRGYEVVYESAQNLFDDFSAERFGREFAGRKSDTSVYTDCDLLIIDDLGAESSNTFTVSCLYNLLNTRIIEGKPVIINTNLTADEIKQRYGDRIYSRLFGEFTVLPFYGTDIRMQKIKGV